MERASREAKGLPWKDSEAPWRGIREVDFGA